MLLSERTTVPCEADGCAEPAVFHLNWAEMRRCLREQHFCEPHAKEILLSHDFTKPIGIGKLESLDGARCFDIELVVISELHEEQVVYLREIGSTRFFPILIGVFEATALDRRLKGFQAPRPLTHDATYDAICELGCKVEHVLIEEFEQEIYYARLCIRQDGQRVRVDMRPSDAFVIAVIADAPIFLSESVIAKLFAG